MNNIKGIDIFISVAAAADYKPLKLKGAVQKIKRNTEVLELKLVKNPDILRSIASLKKPPFTVGFSTETQYLKRRLFSRNLPIRKLI